MKSRALLLHEFSSDRLDAIFALIPETIRGRGRSLAVEELVAACEAMMEELAEKGRDGVRLADAGRRQEWQGLASRLWLIIDTLGSGFPDRPRAALLNLLSRLRGSAGLADTITPMPGDAIEDTSIIAGDDGRLSA